jgi:hypothetical protein
VFVLLAFGTGRIAGLDYLRYAPRRAVGVTEEASA